MVKTSTYDVLEGDRNWLTHQYAQKWLWDGKGYCLPSGAIARSCGSVENNIQPAANNLYTQHLRSIYSL